MDMGAFWNKTIIVGIGREEAFGFFSKYLAIKIWILLLFFFIEFLKWKVFYFKIYKEMTKYNTYSLPVTL